MISIPQLKAYMAGYNDAPERTTSLEQRIQIGSGFHSKWYRSQREHMLGWMVVQECQERKKGKDPSTVDAMGMWNRLKCSPAMFWLAESAGMPAELLDVAEEMAAAAAKVKPMDGDPHGKMMRDVLPWKVIRDGILAGPEPTLPDQATEFAMAPFNRLIEKVSSYRALREYLM